MQGGLGSKGDSSVCKGFPPSSSSLQDRFLFLLSLELLVMISVPTRGYCGRFRRASSGDGAERIKNILSSRDGNAIVVLSIDARGGEVDEKLFRLRFQR